MIRSDLLSLAKKLAPHSMRLRAYLLLLDQNRGRSGGMGYLQPGGRLEQVVYAVMSDLGVNEDGEFIPFVKPGDADAVRYREAIERMRAFDYIGTAAHTAQKWALEVTGADPRLVEWSDTVIRRFEALGCPLFVKKLVVSRSDHDGAFVRGETDVKFGDDPHHFGRAVELNHCLFGRDLPVHCWNCIANAGIEAARAMELDLRWGRYDDDGLPVGFDWYWELADWRDPEAVFEPVFDLNRHNFSKSPPGERDMLLRYYGLEPE